LGIEGVGVADVSEVGAVPNPVAPGETLVITVTAATPPPQTAAVELLIDGEPFGTILIRAGETSGEVSISIPQDTQPVTFTLTARSGATEPAVE
jgi:hypothetical protein